VINIEGDVNYILLYEKIGENKILIIPKEKLIEFLKKN
jgi:hypothetical protein